MELSETERINVLIMKGYGDLQRSYHLIYFISFFRREYQKVQFYTTVRRFEESESVKDPVVDF